MKVKLLYCIVLQLLAAMTILLAVWSFIFYLLIIAEVNDETDDSLEDYTENLKYAFETGQELPSQFNGTNNSYYLEKISDSYIDVAYRHQVSEQEVYIAWKQEYEPARILKTTLVAKDGTPYQLTVYTPTIEKKDLAESILTATVLLALLLLVTITVVFVVLYKKNMRPMYNILSWLKLYKLGKQNPELNNPTDVEEFQLLNLTITESINSIERTYAVSKEFTDNLSHELQTPIAICKNRAENMLNNSCDEQQAKEISKMLSTLDYMQRLNKTILFLSRIENRQFPNVESISINNNVEAILEDFSEIYCSSDIKVRFQQEAQLVITANPTLVKTLLMNLIKNAFIYTKTGGDLIVRITLGQLQVINYGEFPLDESSLFKRFVRGTNIGKKNSTGLGLSICHAITTLYDYDLSYAYSDNRHVFSVKF